MPRARTRSTCCVCQKSYSPGDFIGWNSRESGKRWHAACRRVEKATKALEVPAEEPDAAVAKEAEEKPREPRTKKRRKKTRPEWGPEEAPTEDKCFVCLSPITSWDAIGWDTKKPEKRWHLMCRREFSQELEKFIQLIVGRELEKREEEGRHWRPRPRREMAAKVAAKRKAVAGEVAVTGARRLQDASPVSQ